MVPGELSIMEGFLEEVMSKLRLNEWEGINKTGRERERKGLAWLGGRDGRGWASVLMVAVESRGI